MPDIVHIELQHDFVGPAFEVRGSKADLQELLMVLNFVADGKDINSLSYSPRFQNIHIRLKDVWKAMEALP